jgi:hypothetical protein
MVPGREFRHDSAIGLMHLDLAVKPMGQEPAVGVIDCDRRLIARALNPDNAHDSRQNA